ncbi:MAG: hypothetical protein AB2A00_07705 [Myxococcota bacterium]
MKRAGALALLLALFPTSGMAQETPAAPAPSPTPPGTQPTPDEVELVLKELERESAALPPSPVETPRVVPSWVDQVVPVAEFRLRPYLLLGHPTSSSRPQVLAHLRGRLGAELHVTPDVSMRLVLIAAQALPTIRAPGPELIHDAWAKWRYQALGGEVQLRVGRQEVLLSDFVAFSSRNYGLIPPRFDGVTARMGWGKVFLMSVAAAEAVVTVPPAGAFPDVNGVGMLAAGIQDGPGRLIEMHSIVRVPQLPIHGDAGPASSGNTLLDVGGTAMWEWRGLHARAALDVQQQRFQTPSIFAPPMAAWLSAGYAPEFPWAQGVYADAGVLGAAGQPMRYLPLLADWSGWDGVAQQEFEPLYGVRHGIYGEMDLGLLHNQYNVWARVGLRRGALRNLAVVLHRLSMFDARGSWYATDPQRVLLRRGEGTRDPLIGHEADLIAEAELTRHVILGGSVGLLYSGPQARQAGFGAFAQTAFCTLDLRL